MIYLSLLGFALCNGVFKYLFITRANQNKGVENVDVEQSGFVLIEDRINFVEFFVLALF